MRYRLIVPTVILASLAACARPPKDSQPTEVKVGLLLPQTGSQALTGLKIRNGALLAIDEINAAGGIGSLDGTKLRLIEADSEGKPEVGMSETERLINREHVSAIIGCFQSSVAIPTTALSERYQTPYIVENPMADVITERNLHNVFRITAKSSWMARDQIRFLQEITKKTGTPAKTVLLLFEDTDFGQSTAEGQRKYAREAGLEIVGDLSYPHESPDFHATVLKMQKLAPDVVLATSYDADAALIRKTMAELDYFPNVAFIGSTGGYINPSFISNVGSLADNILTASLWNPDIKRTGVKEFYLKYKKRFGQDPVPQSALTYSSVYVLKGRPGTREIYR